MWTSQAENEAAPGSGVHVPGLSLPRSHAGWDGDRPEAGGREDAR